MSRNIKIGQLSETIETELTIYNKNIVAGTKKSAKKAIKDMVNMTKAQRYDQETGAYRKAISSKTLYEHSNGSAELWYVKAPHYRKAHLLEDGHAKRNGGRTKAYGTIGKAASTVEPIFIKEIEELIKNGR